MEGPTVSHVRRANRAERRPSSTSPVPLNLAAIRVPDTEISWHFAADFKIRQKSVLIRTLSSALPSAQLASRSGHIIQIFATAQGGQKVS
ncbi:hypothetical protein PTKU15_85890 [Paraburkholderia terrae]|nr:hypothetical protein PTKU15_85890 [Paraburkholderia terrae]